MLRLPASAAIPSLSARPHSVRRNEAMAGNDSRRASSPSNGWWGQDILVTHPQSYYFCLGFQNINGFLIDHSDKKCAKLNDLMVNHGFDFWCLQEINLHPQIMGTERNWNERSRWFTGFTHCHTNLHSLTTSRGFFGGTACFLSPSSTHRSCAHGGDPTGLGRWSWSLLRGRQGIHTRIVSGYRPVLSANDEALTFYSQ